MDKTVIWNFLVEMWFSAIPVVLPLLAAWLASRWAEAARSETISNNLKTIGNAAMTAAEAVEQEYVKQIKAGREDGKLTQDERNLAFSMAANKFKSIVWNQLGEKIAKNLTDADTKSFVEAGLKMLKARL